MTLPNFLIIGANKSATTSLHSYLSHHPQVFMSSIKEPMFFVREGLATLSADEGEAKAIAGAVNDLRTYERLFEGAAKKRAIGESSTAYLANPFCAKRIKELVPHMKLIASLREPADRAYSNFRMYRRWGIEHRTFASAVRDELEGRANSLPQGQRYVELGFYGRQLREFQRFFAPAALLIVLYQDIETRVQEVMKRIFEFLEVKSSARINASARLNEVHQPIVATYSSRAEEASTLELLRRVYREDIELTEQLTGIDLGAWK